jgi:YggT family protein
MLTLLLINLIRLISWLITIAVIVDVVVSYFLSPYHALSMFLDRLVGPMLTPIRRVVPPVSMIDFSPLILLILVNILESVLISIISSLG